MFWNFVIRSTSGLIVDKVLEKTFEKANSSLNIWQRQREKNKFSKIYYDNILKNYGNSPYYDSMLRFILKKDIIEAIFENHSSSMNKTKGDQNLISYYIELYKEQNDNSVAHTSFAKKLLYDLYYEILAFNLSSDYIAAEQKIISNQNLNSQNIIDNIQKTKDDIKDEIIHSRKYITENNQTKNNKYYIDTVKLNDYKEKLLEEYQSEHYLSRKIESLDALTTYNDSYQLLKQKQKITITGEAGIGKSMEARNIFRMFIEDEAFQNHIPVYLNLAHYGVLYNSLREGINQTVSEFIQFTEDTPDIILSNESMIIVFDGLDEINDDNRIDKAIAELNNLSFKFNNNYYLITIDKVRIIV